MSKHGQSLKKKTTQEATFDVRIHALSMLEGKQFVDTHVICRRTWNSNNVCHKGMQTDNPCPAVTYFPNLVRDHELLKPARKTIVIFLIFEWLKKKKIIITQSITLPWNKPCIQFHKNFFFNLPKINHNTGCTMVFSVCFSKSCLFMNDLLNICCIQNKQAHCKIF